MNLDELINRLMELKSELPSEQITPVYYDIGNPDKYAQLKLSFIGTTPGENAVMFVLNKDAQQ